MYKQVSTIVSSLLLVALIIGGGLFFINRPQLMLIDVAVPKNFPTEGFSHGEFERLLQNYVNESGKIDYDRWHRSATDRRVLEQYLAAVAEFSPTSSPDRFVRREDALAYWLYAYNAYVIYSILRHWPIESVTDVEAPLEFVKGLGFFYRQRFLFGGESLSLYTVEHKRILESFQDPRIHFVLNCASESCPVLRPELPTGDNLEALLESSTREFINDQRNVFVDTSGRRVVLSTIFRWYRKDFVNDMRRRGLPSGRGVIDYILGYAATPLAAALNESGEYEIVYDDYDWTLNNNVDGQN